MVQGSDIFQYGNSEGQLNLREYIAERYQQKYGLNIQADNILITNGSQQGLDLLGKIILNDGDGLVIEEPGYLGAIQAFSIYKPTFFPVSVSEGGIDIDKLKSIIPSKKPKLMYTVPNFQNPSGISYTEQNRRDVAELLQGTSTLLIEDDPYRDLRFSGKEKTSFKELLPDNSVLLGSFSKLIVPGFRLGWIVATDSIIEKLIIAKQATDLHTSHFTQSIVSHYLRDNDIDEHIAKITKAYGKQCQAMLSAIKKYFPDEVSYTKPEGGMFLWVELPQNTAALDLFDLALKEKVVFVPGDPFYIGKQNTRTLRLSFSCVDEETIQIGIKRLGNAIEQLI